MPWQRATFKGKQVWLEVDASGKPVVRGGRVPMRYSDAAGAKVYGAGLSNAVLDGTSAPVELEAGIAAADPKAGGKKARGSGFGSAGSRTAQQKAMAEAAAKELIASFSSDMVVAFTDGSCRGNPGPAGSGALVRFPDGRQVEASRSLGRGTNNVAELTAIGMALELADEAGVPPEAPMAVLTDSGYSHGVLCRGWKAKANTELILQLRQRLEARPGVEVHWVAGHVGTAGNERADALANAGVAGVTRVAWTP